MVFIIVTHLEEIWFVIYSRRETSYVFVDVNNSILLWLVRVFSFSPAFVFERHPPLHVELQLDDYEYHPPLGHDLTSQLHEL